jgi:hypothetical protein
MQESDISAKVRQSRFSDPFSLQSKQLQPDYVSSYIRFSVAWTWKSFSLTEPAKPGYRIGIAGNKMIVFRLMVMSSLGFGCHTHGAKLVSSVCSAQASLFGSLVWDRGHHV